MRRLFPVLIGGAVVVAAGTAAAQPANDNCFAPEQLSGYGTFAFDTNGASTDGGASPVCNFFSNQNIFNDVWYRWTATASAPVLLETCGLTSLDTKIAVYTGDDCPFVDPIACVDDSCGTQTRVSWFAEAGQTYIIRLGSFGATQFGAGQFTIREGFVGGPFTNPANGSTYYLLTPSSWTAADDVARRLGGNLVTINDADENEFVRANVLGFDGTDRRGWLGFNDVAVEGQWVWASGQPVTYTNWNGGEPNNSGGVEHYAEIFGSNGLWNDNRDSPTVTVFGIVEVEAGANCPADFNGDTLVTTADITAFLSAWFDARANGC